MMKAAIALIAIAFVATSFANFNEIVPEDLSQVSVSMEEACTIDVDKCFAASTKKIEAPAWKEPSMDFSATYSSMCAAEQKHKVGVKEKKAKSEAKTKELCKKNEGNQKLLEKKVKHANKKAAYVKQVAEGKEKYLEKRVKSAQALTVKTAKMGQEVAKKTGEKTNKAEDTLYKKECTSKESGFKLVRESGEKVKVVYMPEPTAAVKKVKKVVKKVKKVVKKVKKVKKVVKVAPAPAPVPAPKVIKKIIKKIIVEKPKHHTSSVKEVLVKTGESSEKAAAKSQELVGKQALTGQETVAKESLNKKHSTRYDDEEEVKKARIMAEAVQKKSASAELKTKADIKTELAVEKVKKEGYSKEAQAKKVAPVVKKKCNPESALEKYVKGCKVKEEKFEKSKSQNEANMKEMKSKFSEKTESIKCKITHDICQDIYKKSNLREERVAAMIADHDKELRAAMEKTANYENAAAAKMKYQICKSASADMSYFAKKFMFGSAGF